MAEQTTPLTTAVVMGDAEWRYVGLVLGQTRLQDPTLTDGRTV